jgi:hypothetical protein
MPYFTFLPALWGLTAAAALAGIYFLRNRYKPTPVSSLLLWVHHRESREGGRRVQRLQTPLLFFLELLAILCLVLAAAGPFLPLNAGARPLIVVLDDSFSMNAGGVDSPRGRALAALLDELRDTPRSVRFILAGPEPITLREQARDHRETKAALEKHWQCRQPSADLGRAVIRAAELGSEVAVVLVLTDQPPPTPPEKGRVQWWAFGKSQPNLAFLGAARSSRDGPDRMLLQVVNFADAGQQSTLWLGSAATGQELRRHTQDLSPRQAGAAFELELPPNTSAVVARLNADALDLDNTVTLLPSPFRPVRVQMALEDKSLRESVEKALKATQAAELTGEQPDLLITDAKEPDGLPPPAWVLHVVIEAEAEAYRGPFILDRTHPLLEEVSFEGLIWGAGKKAELPGLALVTIAELPVLTVSESLTGRHDLWFRYRPALSTLHDSPDHPAWPALFDNLIRWRASRLPGLTRVNLRLGEETTLNLANPAETVRLTTPDGATRDVPVGGRRVRLRGAAIGVWTVESSEGKYAFAVNAIGSPESDLYAVATSRWGDWLDDTTLRLEYQNVAWLLLLAVLVFLVVHLLVWKWRKRGV